MYVGYFLSKYWCQWFLPVEILVFTAFVFRDIDARGLHCWDMVSMALVCLDADVHGSCFSRFWCSWLLFLKILVSMALVSRDIVSMALVSRDTGVHSSCFSKYYTHGSCCSRYWCSWLLFLEILVSMILVSWDTGVYGYFLSRYWCSWLFLLEILVSMALACRVMESMALACDWLTGDRTESKQKMDGCVCTWRCPVSS